MVDALEQGKKKMVKRKETERKTERLWKDSCKRDMESLALSLEDIFRQNKVEEKIHNHSGDPR